MEHLSDAVHFCPARSGVQHAKIDDYEFDRANRLDAYLDAKLVAVNDFRRIVRVVADNLVSIQPTPVHQVLEEWSDCLDILLADCLRMWLVEELP